jgi:hypothetical protein
MAEALLITRKDLVKYTAVNGNVDTDNFIQFIKIAQDIHILNYVGTDLLNKIKSDIIGNTLAGNYETLVETYLKPMLIHWAMVEYLPFASYMISNKGVYKHGAENSQNIEKTEVDFLVEKQRNIAENYTQRFIDYMCNNSSLFPEYNSNSNGDVHPSRTNYSGGWEL